MSRKVISVPAAASRRRLGRTLAAHPSLKVSDVHGVLGRERLGDMVEEYVKIASSGRR